MADEDLVLSIIAGWVEGRERGERVDPAEIISQYPEHAEELRRRFAAMDRLEEAASIERTAPGEHRLLRLPPDRYESFQVAGHGGMGIVYLALDTQLNREVAFKIVRPDAGSRIAGSDTPGPLELTPPEENSPAADVFAELTGRFLQEAWVTGGLEHPGIVPVYELGETPEGVPYYTMRFVKGERTLERAIEEATDLESRLALLEPFLKVCDAIGYAHSKNVIHRDLKPANIALGEFGEVVVLDWGLAKMRDRPDLAQSLWQERLSEYRDVRDFQTMARAMGTPGYMAPEAALGDSENIDERSDVYGLGAILYQILTGRLPFTFETFPEFIDKLTNREPPLATEIDPALPKALAGICAQAVARTREERLPGARALAEAIRTWQRESAVEREVRDLLARATTAYEATEGLAGEALLRQLGRVTAACGRITERRPDHPQAAELLRRTEEARERATRGKLLRRVAAVALVVGIAIAVVVFVVVDAARRQAETAEARTSAALDTVRAERDEKSAALRRARTLALVSASTEAARRDSMLALLLAREAGRLGLRPEAFTRLHAAVRDSLEVRHFRGHGGQVYSAVFSPSGKLVLTASGDDTARLWDLEGRTIAVLRGHTGDVYSARFFPGGKRIVTTSNDGTARLWNLAGETIQVLRAGTRGVDLAMPSPTTDQFFTASSWQGVAKLWRGDGSVVADLEHCGTGTFSPSGDRIVVTRLDDFTARILDHEGKEMAVLRGHDDQVTSVAVSPTGDLVLTSSALLMSVPIPTKDRSARLWDIEGNEKAVLTGHALPVSSVAFSPDGSRILTASLDRTARLWDLEGNELDVLVGHESGLIDARFSPSGDRILTVAQDGTARVWSASGKEMDVLRGQIEVASFSPSGDRILTTGDGGPRLWAAEGKEMATLQGPEGGLATAAFSPSGEVIATGSTHIDAYVVPGDGKARLWRADGTLITTLDDYEEGIKSIEFSPRGKRLLTVGANRTPNLRVWDLGGTARIVASGTGSFAAAFARDGRRILANHGPHVYLWDPDTGELTPRADKPPNFEVMAVSPRDDRVVIASGWYVSRHTGGGLSHAVAHIHDLARREVTALRGHQDGVKNAAFSPDGEFVATASYDGTARLWDLEGNSRAVLMGHRGWVGSAVFSPEGDRILTAGNHDNTARLWNLEGREIAVLRGHRDAVHSAVFSPRGDRILTGSWDRTARLWNAKGELLCILPAHDHRVTAALFSPTGDRILTASLDGTARLWLVYGADLLALADARVTRDFTLDEWRRYGDLLAEADPARREAEEKRIADATGAEEPFIGFKLDTGSRARVRVETVLPGGPGEVAGLESGDVIIRIAERKIATFAEFRKAMLVHQPGDEVTLVVKRGDEVVTLTLTLGRRGDR